ncbi:MAG: hypothetical protein H0V66_01310, partial [Bdellovibrionales bacterium]|nr:hypothetical protein [Bdellovibrionales bacterium]
MFDVILPLTPLDSYKRFIMTYQDGTTYLDTNTTTTMVDSGANVAEARLKADLVEKGQLDDYTTEIFNMGAQTYGTSYRREVLFSNIGTKDIPYIHFVGSKDLLSLKGGVKVIPTNPAKLNASTLDCSTIFDFRYVSGDSLAVINARDNLWDPFPVGKDCILTMEFFTTKRTLSSQDSMVGLTLLREPGRKTYVGTHGTEEAWDRTSTNYLGFNFILDAYDGDMTDPTAVGPYASQFGKYLQGKIAPVAAMYRQNGKIALYAPRPMAGSILYRPGWNRPAVADELGVNFIAASAVPNAWFFSANTEQTTAFSGYDADFHKGILSKNFFPNALALPPVTNYEYVYYMGTVPSGVAINGGLILANTGSSTVSIRSVSINTIQRPDPLATTQNFTTSLTGLTLPNLLSVSAGAEGASVSGGMNTSFAFSGTDAGIYAAEVIINYRDGGWDSVGPYDLPIPFPDTRIAREVQRKILVVGEISNAVPEVQLNVQEYNVETDDLSPAVESLVVPSVVTPMSYFENTTAILNFTSIKIPSPARKDSYIKRRFIISNPSGTTPIN